MPVPTFRSCLTDQTQFDTALLNLVVNARDAMPSGGTIRIATWRCANDDARRMPNLKPGPYACVTVADTGQGMTPDVLKRALEPFFTTKGNKGTGLGLSQVYGFVRQSGGDIRIESEVGVGTTIDLFFPGLVRAVTDHHDSGSRNPRSDRRRSGPSSARVERVIQGEADFERYLKVRHLSSLNLTADFKNFEPAKIFKTFRCPRDCVLYCVLNAAGR